MTKTKLNLVVGGTYYGEGDQGFVVTAIEGDQVHVMHRILLDRHVYSIKEMSKIMKGSTRRTYRHNRTGELRTKVETVKGKVAYIDAHRQPKQVGKRAWDKWRAEAT